MDIDKRIEEMKLKNKGNYITQAVAFNKNCPRQMELLKYALSNSVSFSGLIKEMLAIKINEGQLQTASSFVSQPIKEKPRSKDVGNFI